jgi:hypothetical protein
LRGAHPEWLCNASYLASSKTGTSAEDPTLVSDQEPLMIVHSSPYIHDMQGNPRSPEKTICTITMF